MGAELVLINLVDGSRFSSLGKIDRLITVFNGTVFLGGFAFRIIRLRWALSCLLPSRLRMSQRCLMRFQAVPISGPFYKQLTETWPSKLE